MKRIEAIIRKTKFEEVKESLHAAGIDFFTYWSVKGVGKATESRVYRGVAYDTSSIERLMLSIIVRDINLEPTIKTIIKAAKTGDIGDGKIFVSDIIQSYRIRNEEQGDKSLYINNE